MFPAGVGQQNAPGKPELTASRIRAYLAACGGYCDLQTQQLPKNGTPAAKTALARSIWRVTGAPPL